MKNVYDVKKALAHCRRYEVASQSECTGCPYRDSEDNCIDMLFKDALATIYKLESAQYRECMNMTIVGDGIKWCNAKETVCDMNFCCF